MARRPLWITVVLLLGAAAALWGAGAVGWGDTGEAGAGTTPDLTALALLAVASVAGVYAVGGWMRRLLGAVVVVAGGYVCWRALTAEGAVDLLGGRGLALLGGLLFLAAGVLVVVYARTLPTMGPRYEPANAERRSGDPHKDLWDGLSEGRDPTADGPRT
jgi:hypothetical protein